MPFVRFRWDQANEWDTKDSQGWEGFVTFDIYTNLQGDKQSLAIADVLDNLLTPSFILPLTSCQHLYTRHDSRNTYTQQDGALIHHTVMRYRMIFTL